MTKQTCSKNLQRHLTILKQERNRLLTLHDNGYKIPVEDFTNYMQHKKYVTELLHDEKMLHFNKMLSMSSKKF